MLTENKTQKTCERCGERFTGHLNAKTCSDHCRNLRRAGLRWMQRLADPTIRERENARKRAWRADPINREKENAQKRQVRAEIAQLRLIEDAKKFLDDWFHRPV